MAKIKIDSVNPDYCGEYVKSEIANEMNALGYKNPEEDWIDYVFSHVFEDCFYDEILNIFKNAERVNSLKEAVEDRVHGLTMCLNVNNSLTTIIYTA